jgi:phosphodiesterase/alkaline phosphatase D-like protein
MKHSIVNRMPLFAALAGIVLALAGLAHAGAVGTQRPQKEQKAKKGMLNITVTTEIGGVTLEPGEYEVKQVKSAAGPVVRFTRYTYNPYAQEGLSVHQWDVVAEVRVTMQSLDSKAVRTQLLVDSNSDKPIGLKIRGNSFDYLFATS